MVRHRLISISLGFLIAACAPYGEAAIAHSDGDAFKRPQPVRSPLDPQEPMQLGHAPENATTAQNNALWWVNTYRIRAGLGPLHMIGQLNDASGAHANYVLLHPDLYEDEGLSVHEEAPDRDGFFGERFWERMKVAGYNGLPFREVIAYQATPAAAVAHWMETVYHRLPLLHPAAQHVGYAERHLGKARINVLDVGAGDGVEPIIPGGVVWPPDGATNVALAWDGLESPQPPPPPSGYPSGPVVTLTFALNTEFEVLQHFIKDTDTDAMLPHTLLTPKNDTNLQGESSVALYTDEPLLPGRTYEVRVRGVADGVEFFRSWTFTTRAATSCGLLTQDCGIGRACYGTREDDGVCAWAGAHVEGATCDFQNDCKAGMTCVSSTCRRYCTLDASFAECSIICDNGYAAIDKAAGLGVCAAP